MAKDGERKSKVAVDNTNRYHTVQSSAMMPYRTSLSCPMIDLAYAFPTFQRATQLGAAAANCVVFTS